MLTNKLNITILIVYILKVDDYFLNLIFTTKIVI